MKFYVKVQYLKQVENSDKLKKTNETFVVEAVSVTDAEAKMVGWIPSNWQDANVRSVSKASISDINWATDSEQWWTASIAYQDEFGKSKPFTVALNALTAREAVSAIDKQYATADISSLSKTSKIFEKELLTIDAHVGPEVIG